MSGSLRRILVPSDGSREAESVLGMLTPFARQEGSEVAVLYIGSGTVPARIEKLCDALRTVGVRAWMECREGRPADEILTWAREKQADLVAMTTHGTTGLRRVLTGSVTEEVLRRAEVPVLTARPDTPGHPWQRIVVALDGSSRAEAVLRDAVELSRLSGATVELVQVALPVVSSMGVGEIPTLLPSEDPRPYLEKVRQRLEAVGVPARAIALEGRAATELLRHLHEGGAALVCLTTHGRTGLPRLLLGSISEELLRHASCPVWIRRTVQHEVPVQG